MLAFSLLVFSTISPMAFINLSHLRSSRLASDVLCCISNTYQLPLYTFPICSWKPQAPVFDKTGAMPSATFSAPHTPLSNTYAEQAPPPFSTKVARILSGRSPGYQIIACARLPFMRAKVTSASLPCARLPDYSGGTAGFAGRLKAAPCCLFPILPTWGHLTGFAIFSLPAPDTRIGILGRCVGIVYQFVGRTETKPVLFVQYLSYSLHLGREWPG